MQVIHSIDTNKYYIDVMCDCVSLWIVIYKTYHDSLSLKLRNMLLLSPIFYSFIFLSQLVLDDFDTLKYILWYISYAVVFSSLNILSMVLVIVYRLCECFLNMLLLSLFFWFFYICFVCWHWYNMIFYNWLIFLFHTLDKVCVFHFHCIWCVV